VKRLEQTRISQWVAKNLRHSLDNTSSHCMSLLMKRLHTRKFNAGLITQTDHITDCDAILPSSTIQVPSNLHFHSRWQQFVCYLVCLNGSRHTRAALLNRLTYMYYHKKQKQIRNGARSRKIFSYYDLRSKSILLQ
jgi:hypothetical protein